MKIINFFIQIIVLIILSNVSFSKSNSNIFRYTHKKTGIKIIFGIEKDMFPKSWRTGKINAQAVSLDKDQYKRCFKILRRALNKYPVSLLKKFLKRIYVLKEIKFYNTKFGGTNSKDYVYITDKGKRYSDDFIERLFHAEFSSILLRKNKRSFNKEKWKAVNLSEFNYKNNSISILKKKKLEIKDIDNLKQGFLTKYARSTLENDFNSFAKKIFKADNSFWNSVDSYVKIRKKFLLTVKFYNSLNKIFTEKYFRKISK